MIKNPNCNNVQPKAYEIEELVESQFKIFALNTEEKQREESKTEIIEDAIKKSNTKIKKYYALYAENDSENLLELIQEEELKIKELKKELSEEKARDHIIDGEKIERIRKVSDIWDRMTKKDKNRVLKECIEKIVITNNDLEIRFIF